MGQCILAALRSHTELRLGSALEAPDFKGLGEEIEEGVVLTSDVASALQGMAVVIDFSVPRSTLANLKAAADAGVPYVTGTTGFSDSELEELSVLARRTPVLHAPNFSVAVNVLAWLTREAARKLGPGYDAELFELHHGAKRDAPSGTALRLAAAVAEGRDQDLGEQLILERAGDTGQRPDGAIAVQALRGGDNPGEHTVMFVGRGERLELVHRSATRDHFAAGAVRAAAWLLGRKPGLYRIEQVLDLE
jgi:4-hydroxy-tetrahydrodipicolinate reductase